jgi:dTDP-4-dehydrorhamnose reductase
MKPIVVIGAHGQLGSDLMRLWRERATPLTHSDIEISDPQSIETALQSLEIEYVVNTAAYNAVDRAEQEPEAAFAVNAFGPLHLARYCQARGITLLHVSTDYVFAGAAGSMAAGSMAAGSMAAGSMAAGSMAAGSMSPHTEEDRPEPTSVYGTSKLAGEHLVAQSCSRHFVVRTCGLYGNPTDESKGNFVRTMLRLAGERDELRVVNDQHCTPTSTADLAPAIDALLATGAYGLYHATNSGQTTWYEFAQTIFRLTDTEIRVTPITTAEFAAPAARPAYSVLDCGKLERSAGVALRGWEEALTDYLSRSRAAVWI